MNVRDEILNLPIEEITKMNLLSQLERDIRQKEHWDDKKDHMQLQKYIWFGLVAIGIVAQIIAYVSK